MHHTSTHFTIPPPPLHPPFLTNYLEASVFVKLSDVSCAEPPLAVFIYKEIFSGFCLVLVVSHGYAGSTNQNLSSWMRLVGATVTTWEQGLKSVEGNDNRNKTNILLILLYTSFAEIKI